MVKVIKYTLVVGLVLLLGYVAAVKLSMVPVFANLEPVQDQQNLPQADDVVTEVPTEVPTEVTPASTEFFAFPKQSDQQQAWIDALKFGPNYITANDGKRYIAIKYTADVIDYYKAYKTNQTNSTSPWTKPGWAFGEKYEDANAFFEDFSDYIYTIPDEAFTPSSLTIYAPGIPTPTPAP